MFHYRTFQPFRQYWIQQLQVTKGMSWSEALSVHSFHSCCLTCRTAALCVLLQITCSLCISQFSCWPSVNLSAWPAEYFLWLRLFACVLSLKLSSLTRDSLNSQQWSYHNDCITYIPSPTISATWKQARVRFQPRTGLLQISCGQDCCGSGFHFITSRSLPWTIEIKQTSKNGTNLTQSVLGTWGSWRTHSVFCVSHTAGGYANSVKESFKVAAGS